MYVLKLTAAAISDMGSVRGNNEDNLYFADLILSEDHIGTNGVEMNSWLLDSEKPICIAVFDGMGGESYGERASFLAAQTMQEFVRSNPDLQADTFLKECCKKMNSKICEAAMEIRCKRMGSTAAIVFLEKKNVFCCNVGDSKIYIYNGDELSQASVDHTNADLLRELGISNRKPELTQYLGIPENTMEIVPSISKFDIAGIKKFLICSDGLTDMLTLSQIETLMKESNVSAICKNLVNQANKAGGKDNISLIVGKIETIENEKKAEPSKPDGTTLPGATIKETIPNDTRNERTAPALPESVEQKVNQNINRSDHTESKQSKSALPLAIICFVLGCIVGMMCSFFLFHEKLPDHVEDQSEAFSSQAEEEFSDQSSEKIDDYMFFDRSTAE